MARKASCNYRMRTSAKLQLDHHWFPGPTVTEIVKRTVPAEGGNVTETKTFCENMDSEVKGGVCVREERGGWAGLRLGSDEQLICFMMLTSSTNQKYVYFICIKPFFWSRDSCTLTFIDGRTCKHYKHAWNYIVNSCNHWHWYSISSSHNPPLPHFYKEAEGRNRSSRRKPLTQSNETEIWTPDIRFSQL